MLTNYTIVTPVQYPGQTETEPFARVHVWLDDTDVVLGYQALIEVPVEDIRIGMRLAAVWASDAERGGSGPRHGTGARPRGLDADRRARRRRPRPREQDLLMAHGEHPDDIAIIGWSISPMVRRTDKTEAQLLLEVVSGAVDEVGITKADLDFTCAGSCDYVAGQAFSFVQNIDAVGAWPPKRDSHVEMDGAWALYEAYVRLLLGDIDVALRHGVGTLVHRGSRAHLPDGDGPVLPRATRRRCGELRRAAGAGAAGCGKSDGAADGRDRGAMPA